MELHYLFAVLLLSVTMEATSARTTSIAGAGSTTAAPRPHILYVLLDDYGWADAGIEPMKRAAVVDGA